ncbi:hypothetical protein TWF281_011038 [Arthrobotrys megalospora]
MDGLSGVASAIAVIQITGSIVKICGQYLSAVRSARTDIENVRNKHAALGKLFQHTQDLLDGPHKAKLSASQDLKDALDRCEKALKELETKLQTDFDKQVPTKHKRFSSAWVRGRIGKGDLKWPLSKKEVEQILRQLEDFERWINLAIQIDEVKVVLSIEQEANLAKIMVADGATFTSYRKDHGLETECLPNTRVEVLAEVAQWVAGPKDKRIFWLCGMAGTGKSTISRSVARSLLNSNQLGASFFFKRGEGMRGSAVRFFGTIASDLRRRIPELGPLIASAVAADTDICRRGLSLQFTQLVLNPLEELEKTAKSPSGPIVIVVDALDECDGEDDVKLLLDLLSRVDSLAIDMRVFITSRPETPIQHGWNEISRHIDGRKFILHEIKDSTIKRDISIFLKDEFRKIQELRRREVKEGWPGDDRIESLAEMAIPLFISAATMCRFVKDPMHPAEDRLDAILRYKGSRLASKMDRTYRPILDHLSVDIGDRDGKAFVQSYQQVVGTIILLKWPLSRESLSQLVGRTESKLFCVLDHFTSVINIPDEQDHPIQIFHLSFRDFLLDPQMKNHWFWLDEKEIHKFIAKCCIKVMSRELKQDLCELRRPGTRRSEISPDIISKAISPSLRYASQNWVQHFIDGEDTIYDEDRIEVCEFLKNYFLHWLEALSLLGLCGEAIYQIRELEPVVQISKNFVGDDLSGLFQDMKRLLQSYSQIIDEAPLQLYYSILLFTLECSTIKILSQKQLLSWVSVLLKVEKFRGGKRRLTIDREGGRGAVVFSPDGKHLAFQSDEITIWDSVFGLAKQKLEQTKGHLAVLLAFSDKGSLAAAIRKNNHYEDEFTIRDLTLEHELMIGVWDTRSGALVQTIESCVIGASSMAFSQNGGLLAHGFEDGAIKLWDVESGVLADTSEGRRIDVGTMVFFAADKRLASITDDGRTLRLWNITLGSRMEEVQVVNLEELVGETVKGCSVSQSGTQLVVAIALYSGNIQLWRMGSGETVKAVEFNGEVGEIDFLHLMFLRLSSPARGRLVLWERGSFVAEAWDIDINDAANCKRLGGIVSPHSTADLSLDGKLLAYGTPGRVDLYDLDAREPDGDENDGESSGDWIVIMSFSTDGARLASGSYRGEIALWDPASGARLRTLKENGHTETVLSIAFSPDGTRLVSGSFDHTIKVWDPISGILLGTFECNSPVRAVVFSPNGQQVASIDQEATVQVWDLSYKSEPTLTIKSKGAAGSFSVAYSPDNKILASALGHNLIHLWDPVSGALLRTLESDPGIVLSVTFSLDCKQLASASGQSIVKIWNTESWECCRTIITPSLFYRDISFSMDGNFLRTNYGMINLRDEQTKLCATINHSRSWIQYEGHDIFWLPPGYREGLQFNLAPDGDILASGRRNGRVFLIKLSPSLLRPLLSSNTSALVQ